MGEAAGRGVGGREVRDEVLGLREAARPGGSQAGTPPSEGGAEVQWGPRDLLRARLGHSGWHSLLGS